MTHDLRSDLLSDPTFGTHPLAPGLVSILTAPTGLSTSGYPYLRKAQWDIFRDTIPHLLGMGEQVLTLLSRVEAMLDGVENAPEDVENCRRACRVSRQIVQTAAITAPSDLWLLRHVLGFFSALGLSGRLARGSALYVHACRVQTDDGEFTLDPMELETDLNFLLARGVVEQYEDSYRMAGHPRARALLTQIGPIDHVPISTTAVWRRVFSCGEVTSAELEMLLHLTASGRAQTPHRITGFPRSTRCSWVRALSPSYWRFALPN